MISATYTPPKLQSRELQTKEKGLPVVIEPYQKLSMRVAEVFAALLKAKPGSCFGTPTGRTPLGIYKILSEWSKGGQLDWSQAHCFALDDYLGAHEEDTFAHYLESNLFSSTNLPLGQRHNPRQVADYDQAIELAGGLDLTILGIGQNGHIAFNEPGTPLNSWTHGVSLTDSTRSANASFFGGKENVPKYALTMGIRTILNSRKIILIANGQNKEEILNRAFGGPITADVPASFLQTHPNVEIFTDFDFVRTS